MIRLVLLLLLCASTAHADDSVMVAWDMNGKRCCCGCTATLVVWRGNKLDTLRVIQLSKDQFYASRHRIAPPSAPGPWWASDDSTMRYLERLPPVSPRYLARRPLPTKGARR